MDTLMDYSITYPHMKVTTPTSNLVKMILQKMCVDAAITLERQVGREYGFGEIFSKNPPRAAQLHLLSSEELAGLPTNNLESERHLAGFGRRAVVAKYRNKRFSAKGIRNYCTLLASEVFKKQTVKRFDGVVKLLNEMEKNWVIEQKDMFDIKIRSKIEKGKKKRSLYTQKCLQLCKGWGGPASSVEELHSILKVHSQHKEKIVRNELIYYRETHKADILCSPSLFKVNGITHEERCANLCALLVDDGTCSQIMPLPTNADVESVVKFSPLSNTTNDIKEENFVVGNYYATLLKEGSANTWYIASCEQQNDNGTYRMDHLMRVKAGNNKLWKHPPKLDSLDLNSSSIVDLRIDGEWNVPNERSMTFFLRNHTQVEKLIEEIASDLD